MVDNLLKQSLTVTRKSGTVTDSYGNTRQATSSSSTVLGFISVEGEFDSRTDRDQVTVDAWGYLTADTSIDKTDTVTDPDGNVYQVIEVRSPVRATTGVAHHKEVRLRRVYD